MTAILNSRQRTTNNEPEYATYILWTWNHDIHYLKPKCVEVGVHTGDNVAPPVLVAFLSCNLQLCKVAILQLAT